MNKKRPLLVVSVLLIVMAGLAIAFYGNRSSTINEPAQKTATVQGNSNEKAYGPTDIIKNLSEYENKVITVQGTINQFENKDYYIVGGGKPPGAIRLTFPSKINTDSYANKVQDPK